MTTITVETVRAHCPRCDGERVCNVHGKHSSYWEHDDPPNHMDGGADHQLLECRGCEGVFYRRSSWDSEDVDHWHDHLGALHITAARTVITFPAAEVKSLRPDWVWDIYKVDRQLDQILRETYAAFEAGHLILASIGSEPHSIERHTASRSMKDSRLKPRFGTCKKTGSSVKLKHQFWVSSLTQAMLQRIEPGRRTPGYSRTF